MLDLSYLGPATAILALFGGIALIVWVNQRAATRRRELEHVERLKAIERGLSLPDGDMAWAAAEATRTGSAACVGIFVPLFLGGIAVGGTALILNKADPKLHLPVICTIWGVSGLASLVAVTLSMSALCLKGKRRASKPGEETTRAGGTRHNLSEAIEPAELAGAGFGPPASH